MFEETFQNSGIIKSIILSHTTGPAWLDKDVWQTFALFYKKKVKSIILSHPTGPTWLDKDVWRTFALFYKKKVLTAHWDAGWEGRMLETWQIKKLHSSRRTRLSSDKSHKKVKMLISYLKQLSFKVWKIVKEVL